MLLIFDVQPHRNIHMSKRGSGDNSRGIAQWRLLNTLSRKQSPHGYFEKRYLLVAYFLLDMIHHPNQYPMEPGELDMWFNPLHLPMLFEKIRQYPRLVKALTASNLFIQAKFAQSAKITCNFRKRRSRYYERKSNGHTEQKAVHLRYGPIKTRRGNKKTNRPLGYQLNSLLFDKVNIEDTRKLYKLHVSIEHHIRQHGTSEQIHTYERLHYGANVTVGVESVPPFAYFEAYRYFVYEMRDAMGRFNILYDMPILEANVMGILNLDCTT